jgi:electron transfer flavoprotein alpha subunit
MSKDIWIFVHHRKGSLEEFTFGLIGEARRLRSSLGEKGNITAVTLGFGLRDELDMLGAYGADKVLYLESESLSTYQGELFAGVLARQAQRYDPAYILMAQTSETHDLAPRVAALLQTPCVTRAMDLRITENGGACAIRPIANGYLFEEIHFDGQGPSIISFLPSVLSALEPDTNAKAEVLAEPLAELPDNIKTRVVTRIAAAPEELDLEEADIIVSGGRGVGKDEAFTIIHELAKALGGAVSGTRPVIDWQTLPFERQIGQTGKTVAPRLMVTCGISGANEFTAGMEKSNLVIAINTDSRARIFRFADLGVLGDVHQILPLLIARLKQTEGSV